MHTDPENTKKTVKLSIFSALLGSAHVKGDHRMLMKLTPGQKEMFLLVCVQSPHCAICSVESAYLFAYIYQRITIEFEWKFKIVDVVFYFLFVFC